MMADILVKTPSMGKTVKLFSGSVSSGELIKFRESHSESGRLNMCMFLTTAIDGHLIQKQHFCHHGESICHTNSSYVASKLYGTSACGCNNNTVILKELFSSFLPSMYAGHVRLAVAKHRWCMPN